MNMRTMIHALAALTIALGLAACELYPLNMSKEEWVALTPVQQLDARYKQAEIDRERQKTEAAERRRKQAEELRLARMRQKRVDRIYAENSHREILQCAISKGWYGDRPGTPLAPVAFSIARSERGFVWFNQARGVIGKKFYVEYSDDGNRLTICQSDHKFDCAEIGGAQSAFASGVYIYPTDFKDVMWGNELLCGFGLGSSQFPRPVSQ